MISIELAVFVARICLPPYVDYLQSLKQFVGYIQSHLTLITNCWSLMVVITIRPKNFKCPTKQLKTFGQIVITTISDHHSRCFDWPLALKHLRINN